MTSFASFGATSAKPSVRITTADQTIDNADSEQTLEDGMKVIRPKSGGGITVPITGKASSATMPQLDGRFDGLTAARHYVQIFVSRDSFAAFLPTKDILVRLGLEYEVIISNDDSVEMFLGQKTRESFVQ